MAEKTGSRDFPTLAKLKETLSSDPSLNPGWQGLQHGEGFKSIGRGRKEWEVENYMESSKVDKHSIVRHINEM